MPELRFMRVFLVFFAMCFCYAASLAQTFTGTGGAIPGTSTSQTCFTRTVTGVGNINSTYGLASVCINITHPNDDELEVVLTAPDGTVVPLTLQNGGSGNNYTNTCFSATATNPIKFGTAPFTGSFLPEGYLGAVNNGQNANGAWRLCIQDRRTGGNAGTLNSWSITFNNTPAPVPPVLPGCANTLPSTSSCSTAALVCDFNGQCGSTSGTTVQDWPGSGLDGPCFGLQNNSFIRFVASASTASFSVWVPTSTIGTYNQGGIQMLFFSGTCNSGPVTTYGCYPHILPYSGTGQPLITVVSAAGLTPGNTYYLMIDGFNNDNCNFTIAANTGVNILNVTPANPSICAGDAVNLTASGGNGTYSWSPGTNLNTTTGTTVTANPPGTITYTVTSNTPAGCPITKDVTVNVNPLPAAPSASVTAQPTCTTPAGTITITAPTGAGLEYSINGTTYQPGLTFTGLTPGIYNVTVRNTTTGCTSAATALTVNAVPTPPAAPTATVTAQPTCIVTTGTITVTAPTGAGLQYSIGGPYQASPVFTGLAPGPYNVTVQDAGGCTSAATILTVNGLPPTPPAPTVTVTAQPTCSTPTGSITITAPTGAGILYSIGGPFQASPVFTGLTQNVYNVTVQNAPGCISMGTSVSINAAPATPAAPTATVSAQPTCTTPTGTITITAPTGAGLQYSIGGPYQASPVFTGLAPGLYNVTVESAPGCVSAATTLTVNAAPVVPATPTASVTAQPTCSTPTGTITVAAPTGAGLQYSIGGPYQSSPVFTGLAQGPYVITVQNAAGCISAITMLTINAAPTAPAAPTAGVTTQPTCTTPTGTITVSAPTGAGLEYSINGTTYQASTTFSNVAPGAYGVTVRNTATGCISTATMVTVDAPPTLPAAPAGSVTTQPSCTSPGGEITITAPLGANYEYSLSGAPYQASPVFSNLAPGNYFVTVRNVISGCISPQLPLTVNNNPVRPQQPVVTTVQPGCTLSAGSITVTSPLGAGLEYSTDGNVYQTSPVFSALPEGTYLIRVRNTAGCVSPITAVIILDAVTEPAKPVVTTVQPKCPKLTGSITISAPVGANLEYSINGISYQASNFFDNIAGGNYSVTARITGTTCVSAVTGVTILTLSPQQCEIPTGTDIYFPSAFTPNGDNVNDGFGPGPKSNLGTVTNYSLRVFNRYGEMVFTSNNPLQQWNGSYKGKMLANNSYTWVAKYSFAGSPLRIKKGTVTIIR